MRVTVWVCPTPGCGHYYAAPSAGDLASRPIPVNRQNGQAEGSLGTLSRCPDCASRGEYVDRVPRTVDLDGPDVSLRVSLVELRNRAAALAQRSGYAEANGIVHDVDALLERAA